MHDLHIMRQTQIRKQIMLLLMLSGKYSLEAIRIYISLMVWQMSQTRSIYLTVISILNLLETTLVVPWRYIIFRNCAKDVEIRMRILGRKCLQTNYLRSLWAVIVFSFNYSYENLFLNISELFSICSFQLVLASTKYEILSNITDLH